MTGASHGFPIGEDTVYHPDPSGTGIGEVKYRLDTTDIALVKLGDGITFENKSFQSSGQPSGVEFTQVVEDIHELEIGTVLSMDTPFTGHVEAAYYGTKWARISNDSPDLKCQWVTQHWGWYGQDTDAIPTDSSCGSPVWDEDGKLVCFFRYLTRSGPFAGFGFGVSSMELKNFGLKLSREEF